MKISPVAKLGMLGAFAAGTAVSAMLITSGGHASVPTQIVVRQDAATAAITSAAPASSAVKAAAPKPAASSSSVAVKRPATVQEAPVVNDPTVSAEPSATPADSNPMNLPPGYRNSPIGNPGSTVGDPEPDASISPLPSHS